MRLLLDTNALLWWLTEDRRLGADPAELIGNGSNDVYVSSVSALEMATKEAIGKLRVPSDLREQMEKDFFEELPVTVEHGLGVRALPLHHRDPFDRLLVAQARHEDLVLVTADSQLHAYDVRLLLIGPAACDSPSSQA